MHNKECEIIRDLMSIHGRTSRASRRMISDHIRSCPDCRALWERRQSGFHWSVDIAESTPRTGSSARYFRWSLEALGMLISLLSLIVNYAVEREITWGWITVGSIVCCIIPIIIYNQARRLRFLKALACFSLLVPLLLGVIQLVVLNGMGIGSLWYWRVALPLAAIWLAAVWIGIVVSLTLRRSGFDCLALVLLLFIPAYIASRAVAVAYTGEAFTVNGYSIALFALSAVVMYVTGVSFQIRQRKKGSRP